MSKFQYRADAVLLAINSLDQETRVTPVGVKTLRNGVLEMDEYIKSLPLPVQAHSKTEYKRMVAQGANVLPPKDIEHMERERNAAQAALNHNLAIANKTSRHAMRERNEMVRTLRTTYSAAEIALMVGVTRQRVHQILNESCLRECSALEQDDVGNPCVYLREAIERAEKAEAERDDYKNKVELLARTVMLEQSPVVDGEGKEGTDGGV